MKRLHFVILGAGVNLMKVKPLTLFHLLKNALYPHAQILEYAAAVVCNI